MKNRKVEIDIMKGIAILLVMVGHAAWIPEWLGVFIASFHMPLFFIISGYFAKTYEDVTQKWNGLIRKDFKQLIVPYLIVACISCTYALLQALHYHDMSLFTHAVARFSFAMDTIYDNTLIDRWVGPMWFVLALFWARQLFYWLSKTGKWFLPICVFLSLTMILLHPFMSTPWGISRGIAALIFLAVGYAYHKYAFPLWLKILAVLCWIASMSIGHIEVSLLQFNCLPIDIIGACGGTLVIYYISKGIARTFMEPFFSWCGRNSLIILCAHSIELSITIVHIIVTKMPFKIPQVLYYAIKHVVTLTGAWVYSIAKNRIVKQ